MPQMNVLSIDNMQATDSSAVNSAINSESALGPWNESSGKFAELINQHQQENSGKSSPRGGKKTDQSDASVAKNQQSTRQADQANDRNLLKAEQANETSGQEDKSSEGAEDVKAETVLDAQEKNTAEKSNVSSSDQVTAVQDNEKNGDQAEHLKLLAMLKAADDVSTEHTPAQDKGLSDTEEAKLAKMLAQLQSTADKGRLTANKPLKIVAGDTPPIVVQQADLPINYEVKTSDGEEGKLASAASITLQAKVSQASVEVALANNEKSKESINSQSIASLEANKLAKEGELADKAKVSDKQTIKTLDANVSEATSDADASDIQDLKAVKTVSIDGKYTEKNTEKNNVKENTENKKEQQLSNKQSDLKELTNQSKVTETVSVTVKGSEVVKDIIGVSNSSTKDNTVSERLNLTQQFGQNNSENKGQSGQGNTNNEGQTLAAKATDSESADTTEVKATEVKPTDLKQELSAKQRIEQETAALSDNKQAIANLSNKDTSAFKAAEINPYNNIHSTSFLQAETQAASQVIEKAASDAIDAMTQKKTLNVHNEAIAIYRKDFSVAVKDKVMVMISQKLQQVEIRLDPPELGSMHVKVNLQNEQAVVSFIVQNQQAKEALDQNMGKLRDMLAQNGVDVGDANVEQQQQQSSGENSESGRGRHFNDSSATEVDSQQTFVANANLYKASATSVDYYA